MKKKILRNPLGSRDWLPEEVNKQEFVKKSLVKVFELWGYQPIQTPILINRETLDISSRSLGKRAFNLIDKQGDVLSLRADLTTPVARVAAERFQGEELPLRFYYVGKVFRYHARKTTNERELFQIGVELIGSKEGLSDLECMKIFADSMDKVGLKDYLILCNHSGLWRDLFDAYGDLARKLYKALTDKDLVLFKTILKSSKLSKGEKEFWQDLIELKGGKEVLPKMKALSKKSKKIKLDKYINYYKKIFELFTSNVEIDLGLTKNVDYYSGIYFEAMTPYIGRNIGAGGRYDELIGKFGYDVPAIGFSFCLEDVLLALEKQGKKLPETKRPKLIKNSSIKATFNSISKLQKKGSSSAVKL